MELTEEDIKHIIAMWKARQKRLFYSSKIVADIYNKLLNAHVTPSNCSNCNIKRIDEIWNKYQQLIKQTEPTNE